LLAKAAAVESQLIVAVGGDGSLNECVNGIMQFSANNPSAVLPKIALLPEGSGNDFARNFGWPKAVNNFLERLAANSYQKVDVGAIAYGNNETDYFINAASAGLGPQVVKLVSKMPKSWNGNLKFGLAAIGALCSYQKKDAKLAWSNQSFQGKILAVVCANGKYFGSGIGIAPDAVLTDGLLNITLIGNIGLWQYLRYLPALKRCEKIVHPHVHYFTTQELLIEMDGSFEKDGELGKQAPARVYCIPSKLDLLS
jgi:YegS/Rv2252/BmrU family lipid kinase